MVDKIQNLIILRSFSKGHELAGLRIGYVVSNNKNIEHILKQKLKFNVSSVSVECALIALDEETYVIKIVQTIMKRKKNFETFLKSKGYKLMDSYTNMTIIKFSNTKKASQFNKYLAQVGYERIQEIENPITIKYYCFEHIYLCFSAYKNLSRKNCHLQYK